MQHCAIKALQHICLWQSNISRQSVACRLAMLPAENNIAMFSPIRCLEHEFQSQITMRDHYWNIHRISFFCDTNWTFFSRWNYRYRKIIPHIIEIHTWRCDVIQYLFQRVMNKSISDSFIMDFQQQYWMPPWLSLLAVYCSFFSSNQKTAQFLWRPGVAS